MLGIRTLSAVVAVLLYTSFPTPVLAQARAVGDTLTHAVEAPLLSADGDTITLRLDQADGTPLIDLLALFEQLLEVPISYQHEYVFDVRVRMLGDLTVPRDGVRKLLDTLVRPYGLVTWDAKPGEEALVTVGPTGSGMNRRMGGPRRWGHEVIPLSALDQEPERVSALYTTVFQLAHTDARSMMGTLSPFVSSDGEMIRSIEQSNSVAATAFSMGTLREIRDLIALVDVAPVPGSDLPAMERRVEKLEARVRELEKLLEASSEDDK